MQHKASLQDRLIVGLGIIFSIGIVALPATLRQDGARPMRRPVPEAVVSTHWFGRATGLSFEGVTSDGAEWRPVGPLQFEERSDGSARLTGFLMESSKEQALLQLDLRFTGVTGVEASETHPGSYSNVSGFLRGLGSTDGILLSVASAGDMALDSTARHADVTFRSEWIQQSAEHRAQHEGPHDAPEGPQGFSLDFSREASWGTTDLAFELGGVEGQFELIAGGHLVEHSDGTATISAVLAQRGFRARAFHLEMKAESNSAWNMAPIEDPSANPLVGPTGLVGGSRSVDPSSWRVYDQLTGTLRGMDAFEGALIEVSSRNSSLSVGVGVGEDVTSQGAFATFFTSVVRGADSGDFAFSRGKSRGALDAVLGESSVQFAFEASTHRNLHQAGAFAADLGELGGDFVFEAGAVFTERSGGRAHFAGQIVRASDPSCAYSLDMELSGLRSGSFRGTGTGDNWSGLEAWAFAENGGPVSPESWRDYEHFEGRLMGLRSCAGTDFEISDRGQPFQIGVGANGRSLTEGAYGQFNLESVGSDDAAEQVGFVSFDLRGSSEEAMNPSSGGLWIDHIGDDFQFTSGGRLRQEDDGSAWITGIVSRQSFPTQRFFVDMQLDGRFDPAHVELKRPAWTQFRSVRGQLVGLDGLRGARLEIQSMGGSAQLGIGAHGDLQEQGAQIGFDLHVTSQPTNGAPFRREDSHAGLAMQLTRTLELRAEEALAAPFVQVPGGHALSMPGIAEDFVFPSGGMFREYADGSATLEGHLVSVSNPDLGFDIQVDFRGRFEDERLARTERTLPASAYSERKGPVDTGLWAFYRSASGILVGTDDLAGSVMEVKQGGTALQIGLGANGRNLEYGASGKLDVRLLSQPVGGRVVVPSEFPACEVHIDLPRSGAQQ